MGNELIGKIYFSVDNEDWYGDTSKPVLHGFHLLDYVQLETESRIQLLIKIIPFVLPRIKEVSHKDDEPFEFDAW